MATNPSTTSSHPLPFPPEDIDDVDVPKIRGPYKPWNQQWEELAQRSSGESYNPHENRADRLFQATRTFNEGRFWPKYVRESWDQWLLYEGILNIMPVWRPKCQEGLENGDDDDDDDGLNEVVSPNGAHRKVGMSTEPGEKPKYNRNQVVKKEFKKRRPRPPYVNHHMPSPVVETPEEIQQLLQESRDRKADRVNDFLNDPAKSVQVFLSSYMTMQSFTFMECNLTLFPQLLRFYVNFLLKDHVFASELEIEDSLQEALRIIDLAQSELPLTSQINKRVPSDRFSEGCEALFGVQKQNDLLMQALVEKELSELMIEQGPTGELTLEELVESNTLQILDDSAIGLTDLAPASSVTNSGNTVPVINGMEIVDAPTNGPENSDDKSEDWETNDVAVDQWLAGPPATLLPFGPTIAALPKTHTSGVVESSMRKIISIAHPADPLPETGIEVEYPSAEAVEAALSTRLSKVEMQPWLGWEIPDEGVDAAVPQIMGSSRGRVIVYDKGQVLYKYDSDRQSNAFAASYDGDNIQSSPPAHDPLNHSITLLLEPEIAKMLKVNMGLEGTWVQIARKTDLDLRDLEEKSKGSQTSAPTGVSVVDAGVYGVVDSSGQGQRFWYLTNLLTVLPTYHTIP